MVFRLRGQALRLPTVLARPSFWAFLGRVSVLETSHHESMLIYLQESG